ncbi:MAG TPA: FHA domain-containing protein [Phototrophicaceae bacterium]|nr:FHA domain-containing protein [Phototrophicaceae bacterium]
MSEPQSPWVIEINAAPMPKPIRAQFEKKLVIGRFDKATNTAPDIDLLPFGADTYGISRQHAALVAQSSELMIVDLNSGNGTYVNGVRLVPHKPTPLRGEDRVQLANLPVEVRVLITPSYAVGFYNDVGIAENTVVPASGQTVLIVHEDEEIGEVLADALGRCGFKTVVARSVVTAIRAFNQKRPSAIVLNWMLQDMPGEELCRYVRRDARFHMTPLVVIARQKTPALVDEALDAGANVVLAEPISIREVQHVVTTLGGQPENKLTGFETKHLVGTAPLQAIQPQTRKNSLVLFIAGSKEPMVLTVNQPITFGRSVSQNSLSHVDLTRSNAVDYGVSRVHARLIYENGNFYIEDVNSVNGTYLNGDPLQPGLKAALKNADELRLGRLRMYIYFLDDAEKSE